VAAHQGWLPNYVVTMFYPITAPLATTKLEVRQAPESKATAQQAAARKRLRYRVRYAHGILMGFAFLGLYPIAALLMRVGNFRHTIWIHAVLQIFAMLIMYSGMGTGIWIARANGSIYGHAKSENVKAHEIIGTIVPALMILQPVLGYLHHRGYVKTGAQTVFTFAHKYYGRILMLAGAINGIVGRGNEKPDYAHGRTIYSSIFSIMLGIYVVVTGVTAYLKGRKDVVESTSPAVTISPTASVSSPSDHEKEV
jgi:hypothetical protein